MNVLLQNKTVKALFRNVKNGEIVSALLLQIEPQPHVVHQSFRFYQPEQTFLSKFIRLNLRDIQGVYCNILLTFHFKLLKISCGTYSPTLQYARMIKHSFMTKTSLKESDPKR